MSTDAIKEALRELENSRNKLDKADIESRERLEQIVDYLDSRIKKSKSASEHEHGMQTIKDAIVHFEVKHPTISSILNEVEILLVSLGI